MSHRMFITGSWEAFKGFSKWPEETKYQHCPHGHTHLIVALAAFFALLISCVLVVVVYNFDIIAKVYTRTSRTIIRYHGVSHFTYHEVFSAPSFCTKGCLSRLLFDIIVVRRWGCRGTPNSRSSPDRYPCHARGTHSTRCDWFTHELAHFFVTVPSKWAYLNTPYLGRTVVVLSRVDSFPSEHQHYTFSRVGINKVFLEEPQIPGKSIISQFPTCVWWCRTWRLRDALPCSIRGTFFSFSYPRTSNSRRFLKK